jgi:TPR repeat protein
MYEYGLSVQKDDAHAVTLYQRGCDGEVAVGCYYLGLKLINGFGGLIKDAAQARVVFQRASDAGYAPAFNGLGLVTSEIHEKNALFQRACDGGVVIGCVNVAYSYAAGRGVTRDDRQAVTLFQRACNEDYASGCLQFGVMAESGRGVARDFQRAKTAYQFACDAGIKRGCDLITKIGLASGLISLSRTDVEARLGQPSQVDGSRWTYSTAAGTLFVYINESGNVVDAQPPSFDWTTLRW